MNKQNFIRGAFILTILGFIGKAIGAVYRVPLTKIIGVEGLGLYQLVFPLYSLLLTISSSAFPNAISKMLSECYAKKENVEAARIFKYSLKILTVLSIACCALVVIFAQIIAKLQGNIKASVCYYGIAPAIIIVAFISSIRGYFQAKENMTPSAVSGLIEQFSKLIFGLLFATIFIDKGVEFGAFGALLGVTISEICALIYLLIKYYKEPKCKQIKSIPCKETIKNICKITIPITLGSIVLPLSQFIDSTLIVNILVSSGFSVKVATKMFGIQTGAVGSIVNMPVVFSLSIASAILPTISRQNILEKRELHRTINKSILITVLFGIVSSIAIYFLATPIIKILYGASMEGEDLQLAIMLLKLASISVIYLSIAQTTTGILQGLGRINLPVYSLLIGGIVKLILNIILVRNPQVNIFGAEIATIVCYSVVSILNLVQVYRVKEKRQVNYNCKINSKNV